jgi:cell division protein FtsW (lipid II flippase)
VTAGDRVTAAGLVAALRPRSASRPRLRRRELGLLIGVAVTLLAGSISLGYTQRQLAARLAGDTTPISLLSPADLGAFVVYLLALFGAHVALVLAGRRTDQILLPTVGLLGGIGLLLMERLPQNLAGSLGGLAHTQLVWLLLSLGLVTALAVFVRNDAWLRRYKYTWAAIGVGLLLLVLVLGHDVNGARLGIKVGPITAQPSELLKVILVVFLAGYLSENQPLLVEESTKLGPISIPPLPYVAPMVAMWAMALGIVVIQRDLGAALLFFLVFLLLLYVATARAGFVVIGHIAAAICGVIVYAALG